MKTNGERNSFWLLNKRAKDHKSPSHVYVFVNLQGKAGLEYYIVPSAAVANHVYSDHSQSGDWYSFDISDARHHHNAWGSLAVPIRWHRL